MQKTVIFLALSFGLFATASAFAREPLSETHYEGAHIRCVYGVGTLATIMVIPVTKTCPTSISDDDAPVVKEHHAWQDLMEKGSRDLAAQINAAAEARRARKAAAEAAAAAAANGAPEH